MSGMRPSPTRFPALLAAIALALALGLAACGDDAEDVDSQDGSLSDDPPAESVEGSVDQEAVGIFVDNCGQCHTLAVAGTDGQVGPNLDDQLYDTDDVLTAIRQGPGAMSANLIEGEDAQKVAELVAGAQPLTE